jgi:hypothetical protein
MRTRYVQPEREQTVGSTVDLINQNRLSELKESLFKIDQTEQSQLSGQDDSLDQAIKEVSKVRDFLGHPEKILGGEAQKHGEIAENIEVNIRNARSIIEQQKTTATFDGVGRTAPEDYIIDGVEVQSKFINGANNTLKHIIEHMDKYKDFGRDGSYYDIPKDQHAIMQKIINGEEVDGLASKSINAIQNKIQQIEAESGKHFGEMIRPSTSSYDEVQKGVVFKTVDGHEESLVNRNEELKASISQDADSERDIVNQSHAPSWGEAAKVGATGAAIGAGFSVGVCIYKKYRAGKKLTEFGTDDWGDVGIELVKGGAKGGVSGLAIYGITNFTDTGAPLASAFVSATFGIASLTNSYRNGEISFDTFVEQGQVVCFDTGVVALGATVGQALIPIPIVGTLVGTFAAKAFLSIAKDHLGEDTKELQQRLDNEYQKVLEKLDQAYKIRVQEIVKEYERLGQLTSMAFNFEKNAQFRLGASANLAREYGVPEERILDKISSIDNFMTS